jgi:membrane-associated phospholipid phosphatase
VVVWWGFSSRVASSSAIPYLNYKFWFFMYFESIVFLIFSSTYQTVVMEYIKVSVGAPRPIYHALNIWAAVTRDRLGWRLEAHRSFPSGHSATTSSGMGAVILLLLSDAYLLRDHYPTAAKVVAHLSVIPFAITLYVGITRIRDYWHFPIDVAVGWVIGALMSVFSFLFLSGEAAKTFLYLYDSDKNETSVRSI